MEKDASQGTNSTPEVKGPTLDAKNEAQSKGEVEIGNPDVMAAAKEPKDKPSTLIAERTNHVRDNSFGSPISVSPIKIKDDKMTNADLIATEKENDVFLSPFETDEHIWKSALSSPLADVFASHLMISDLEKRKTDLIVNGRENKDLPGLHGNYQKKDEPVAVQAVKKGDLIVTSKENEDLLGLSQNEQIKEDLVKISKVDIPQEGGTVDITKEASTVDILKEDLKARVGEIESANIGKVEGSKVDIPKDISKDGIPNEALKAPSGEVATSDVGKEEGSEVVKNEKIGEFECKTSDTKKVGFETEERGNQNLDEADGEVERESVFDGTEVPGLEVSRSMSSLSLDPDSDSPVSLSDKAAAVRNFMREKSIGAVSTVIRRFSGKSDDEDQYNSDEEFKAEKTESVSKELLDTTKENETKEVNQKMEEKAGWNPLSIIGISRDADMENKAELHVEETEGSLLPMPMKGRILLYSRLGCKECKEARNFLRRKRLRYVEINIDVYPSRKLELEKIACSTSVPRVFFNEILIGGVTEMKTLDKTGKLKEKIEYVVTEATPYEAPLPPLSGEDDMSTFGAMDELAVIVRKMKENIVVKDRFHKMRRFTNCFVGSEAVDFLSEDQYLERADAVEFGRKLANSCFFQHVLEENLFEDGNHLYRFLDQDPVVMSQCYNMPRGITEIKPKPITDISSRLRFLSYAILEAYTSGDGRHVDYRSIHGSEEFARYLRIIEELQRVDLNNMPREEKLSFFINLFNMMVIHSMLMLGHPNGALDRRKMLGDFKYVIGGCTYSLSAIQNGILRANQRPPYTLTKPFGLKDRRAKVALPYPEPLIHFALVFGNRSSPPLRCYSPGDIDKELMEAARNFLRSGGLSVDLNMKVTSASKILKWYSVDFGKNEVEVLKHAANYLEPKESEGMLELLATTQLKVVYQPYDWSLNN